LFCSSAASAERLEVGTGAHLHPSLPEEAVGYLFDLVKNYPFVDGDERVGLAVAPVRRQCQIPVADSSGRAFSSVTVKALAVLLLALLGNGRSQSWPNLQPRVPPGKALASCRLPL